MIMHIWEGWDGLSIEVAANAGYTSGYSTPALYFQVELFFSSRFQLIFEISLTPKELHPPSIGLGNMFPEFFWFFASGLVDTFTFCL